MNCEIYRELCGPNAIQIFLMMMGILSTGIAFSFIQTAFMCRNSFENSEEEEYSEEEEEEETYTNKYNISEAQHVEIDKVKLAKHIVIEETPNGNVLMKYNFEDECFVYWSEFNRITYNELCTVARKFVTTYNCKDLYKNQETETETETKEVDVSNNVVETSDKNEETATEEEPKNEVVKPSVFANLKSRKNKEKQTTMTEESFETNSFKRLGSLTDFEHAPKTEVKVEEKNISYGLFKSMSMGM